MTQQSVATIAVPDGQDEKRSSLPINEAIDSTIKRQEQIVDLISALGGDMSIEILRDRNTGERIDPRFQSDLLRIELAEAKIVEMTLRAGQSSRQIRDTKRQGQEPMLDLVKENESYLRQKYAWMIIKNWAECGLIKTEELVGTDWYTHFADGYTIVCESQDILNGAKKICDLVLEIAKGYDQYDGPEFFGDRPPFLITRGVVPGIQGYTASDGYGVLVSTQEVPFQSLGKTILHEADHAFTGVSAIVFLSEAKSMMMQSVRFPGQVDFLRLEIPDFDWLIHELTIEDLSLDPREIVDKMLRHVVPEDQKRAVSTSIMYYLSPYLIRGIIDYKVAQGFTIEDGLEDFLTIFKLSKMPSLCSTYERDESGEYKKLIDGYKCVVPDREVYAELLCLVGITDFQSYLGYVLSAVKSNPSIPFTNEQIKILRQMFKM